MKKVMLIGLLALSSAASVAFAMQSNQTKRSSARAETCKKVILTCADGTTYYKCVLGSTNSRDCWNTGPNTCNITEYPCHGGPVGL